MIILGVMSLALLCLTPAWGGDGGLDPSFNPGVGVQKIPIIRGQVDYLNAGGTATTGVSLIYGYFTSVTDSTGTHTVSSIAKLNDTSGTVDTTFNIPVVGTVRGAFLVSPSSSTSQIIIWGQFSLTAAGATYYNLARLKWDTSGSAYVVDTDFPHIFNLVDTGQGVPVSTVNGVAVQSSTGNILVGGVNMQVVGDTSHAYHLIRLTSAWAYDSAYSTANPARSLPGGLVNGINLGDANFPNQARIFGFLPKSGGGNDWMELTGTDLSTIEAFLVNDPVTGVDGPIYGMLQSAAGQPWVIWGSFKTAFGTAIRCVARLTADLSGLDSSTTFNSNIISGGSANSAVLQGWGQSPNVVLTGDFTAFNGTTCGHLVRLKTDGTVDNNFNTGGSGFDDRPFRLYQPTGSSNFQIVGAFRNYNGASYPRGGIVTLNSNGALQSSYASVSANSDTPGTVYASETIGDGSTIIGGDFTGVGGKYHANLARLNYDGSTDHSFGHNVDGVVNSLRSRESRLLVGGNFGMVFGAGRTSLAKVNIDYSHYPTITFSLDNSFNPKVTKANGTVAGIHSADVDDSGSIMIMGHFDTVNGSASTAIARLLSTGDLDTSFTFDPASMPGLTNIRVNGADTEAVVHAMAGKATYQGSTHGFAARLLNTGALDTSFATGQSPVPHVVLFDGEVTNGSNAPGGGFFLCGNFTHIIDAQGLFIPRGYIVGITANGLLDTTWAPVGANGPIISMNTQPNGKILIGGSFTTYNTTGRNNVARLNPNGSLDTGFNPGSGANGPVYQITYWGQNKALIAGGFTTYNGTSRPGIAMIRSVGQSSNAAINYLLLLQ